jgi:hypothetical protein
MTLQARAKPAPATLHVGLHRRRSATYCVRRRCFLLGEVAFVITSGQEREGEPGADSAVLHIRRCGLRLYPGPRLRLVFVRGTIHRPQVPDDLRDTPQEKSPKAKGAVQARRLDPLLITQRTSAVDESEPIPRFLRRLFEE